MSGVVTNELKRPTLRGRELDRCLLIITLLATLAPVFIVIVTLTGRDYVPVQDFAVFHLRLRDVLSTDTPMLGVYSQYGWNHPGPAGYWMVAPFVWIAGGEAWGMLVGSAIAQGAAIGATAVVTRRAHSNRAALIWVSIAALGYGATGPWVVLEAWNPHIALPFYVLFLASAWSAAITPGSYLPTVFVTGSILVHLHIGYAPLVLPVWVWLIWRRAKAVGLGHLMPQARRRLALWLVVLWSAPVMNDVLRPPGNLARLVDYFVLDGGSDSAAGPIAAIRQLADAVRLPPPWLLGSHSVDDMTGAATGSPAPWALVAALAVLTGLWARRSASEASRSLLDLAWVSLAAGLIALVGLRGQVRLYQFYWIDVLAVLLLVATTWAAWSARSKREEPETPRRGSAMLVGVLAVAAITVSTARTIDLVAHRGDVHRFESVTRELLDAALITPPSGPTIVRWVGSPLGGVQAGVVNGLDRAGVDVRVDLGGGFQWGYQREADVVEVNEVWMVSESGYAGTYLSSLPGARIVATTTPLDAAEEAELVRLQYSIAESLMGSDRLDLLPSLDNPLVSFILEPLATIHESDRDRLGELNTQVIERGPCRCAIVAFPADLAPSRTNDRVIGPVVPAG